MIGKILQIFALAMLPLAMLVQLLTDIIPAQFRFGPAQLLVALVFGAAAFYLGRMLEGYAIDQTTEKPSSRKRKSK